MNKLTKYGCSALCGSLAAISAANAGELSVTGGADMTWVSKGGDVNGNPLGIGSNYSLLGSGELDNGWTYDLTIANGNSNAFSAAIIKVGMGGLGTMTFNQGNSGTGIKNIDDKMPTAWEETWGAGATTGVRLATGSGTSQSIMYSTPTLFGTSMTFTVAPDYGTTDTADKTTAASQDTDGKSYDATININPSLGTEILSGLNIFAGASTIERNDTDAPLNDAYEGVGGVTYDIGPLSLGAQWSGEYTGAKTIDGDGPAGQESVYNFYKNFAYGMAFNINDDLSLSYGEWRARKAGYTDSSTEQTDEANRTVTVTSFQIAYTMGGASIRIADTEVDNQSWTANQNRSVTTVSMGLAF